MSRTIRIRRVKSIDDNPADHVFVRLPDETWLELKDPGQLEKPDLPQALDRFLESEKGRQVFGIRYGDRAFRIGLVKDWTEETREY